MRLYPWSSLNTFRNSDLLEDVCLFWVVIRMSHCSTFCPEYNAQFSCLLPHITHLFQLLDLTLFKPLKTFHYQDVTAFSHLYPNISNMKSYFGKLFAPAGKRKMRLKLEIQDSTKQWNRSNMAKRRVIFQSDISNLEEKEEFHTEEELNLFCVE
jgi:hypothetical protein